ncbi:MAG: MFS transporter, partial [Actinomycetota bacterium]
EVSNSASQISGPGAAGLLIQWLTAPFAVAVDAVSFVASAVLVARITARETVDAPATRSGLRREIAEGLRYLVRDPRWRAMSTFVAVFNFGAGITGPLIIVYAVRRLGLSAGELGLVFMLGNVGWLAGAATAQRIGEALGIGRAMLAMGAFCGAISYATPLTTRSAAIPVLVVAQAVGSFALVVLNVNGRSLYQALVPPRLLGRMNASRRWIVWGIIPLGNVLGGALATAVGLRTTLFAGGAIVLASSATLCTRSIVSIATVDGDARAPGDGSVAAAAE